MTSANEGEKKAEIFTGGIPLNVTLHAWPIPNFNANSKLPNDTSIVTGKNFESAKNYTSSLHNLNATGYVAIDDDLSDTGFTDVQTFILAGIATVIPLLIMVATILGIRFLWKKYKTRKSDGYEGVLQKDESSEPFNKLQAYSLPPELKTSESQFTIMPGEDLTSLPSPQLLTPKSNGSVITMTLKNNHLIVETEETVNTPAGIKIESKGTTTKFVTSVAPDFKIDMTAEKSSHYKKDSNFTGDNASTENILSSSDHGALVHRPPEETEDELDKRSCNTGLSQSDLSVSSSESQNPSYRYGNQRGYDSGGFGYPEYSGYTTFTNKQSQPNSMGPKEPKAYFRSSSVIEPNDTNLGDNEASEPRFKSILLSDVQVNEKIAEENKRASEKQKLLEHENFNAIQSKCEEENSNEKSTKLQSTKPNSEFFRISENQSSNNEVKEDSKS